MLQLDDILSRQDQIATLARRFGWRLVVLFGSVAADGEGRDVDFAVLPDGVPTLRQRGRWQVELEALFEPFEVDLVALGDATNPVIRFEALRSGHLLFESEAGLFDREQDRAFFLYADSEKFRRATREMLRDGH